MKILIVTHTSNDIFIYNFCKWLKIFEPGWEIDIFEFYSNPAQGFTNEYYDSVTTVPRSKNKFLRFQLPKFFSPFYIRHYLKEYISGKHYDIIQCHWIISPMVVSSFLHKYCDKLYVTFWGGELNNGSSNFVRIFHSKQIYMYCLGQLLNKCDGIINSKPNSMLSRRYPFVKEKFFSAHFGSAPLESLYALMQSDSKQESKQKLGIEPQRISVMIGYSGKTLHQHIPIIEELKKNETLKSRIHLLAPMTRDANLIYKNRVEKALKESGFSHTLLFGKFMSDREMAQLRNATDVTMQLSDFDGYSRSIDECLCAKSLVIYGAWLNGYKERLASDGFYAREVSSIENAVKDLEHVVCHLSDYEDLLKLNSEHGKGKNLWSECIKDWIEIYKNNQKAEHVEIL